MAITAAHTVLINCGIEMSASKVARLVQRFDNRAAHHGWSLFDYIATHVAISAEQRRQALNDPDIEKVIAYRDPTGEIAVDRVKRERGY